MQWSTILPILPPKPRFGDACNQCGYCCLSEPCSAAVYLVGVKEEPGACPLLEWDETNKKTRCGLVRAPGFYIQDLARAGKVLAFLEQRGGCSGRTMSDKIRSSLSIGEGCDTIQRRGPDADIPYFMSEEDKNKLYESRLQARMTK